MKIDFSFPRNVLMVLFVGTAIAGFTWSQATPEQIRCFFAGAALSTLNILAGYAAIEYSIGKSYTTFLKMVLGGMGVRLGVMIVGLLVLIKVFSFDAVVLVVSTLVFYAIYLGMEVFFIQKKVTIKNQS